MIYAKCIRGTQIINDVEEFKKKVNLENTFYCKNEVSKSFNGQNILYCVPLNFIYDCLKYGEWIAIIEVENYDTTYPRKGSYMGLDKASSEQKVIDLMKADSKEAVDFVFNEVGDPELVHDGYVHWLSPEIQKYFNEKKWGNK